MTDDMVPPSIFLFFMGASLAERCPLGERALPKMASRLQLTSFIFPNDR